MLSTGLFLFGQVHETPRLALQMTIVSSLLVVCGLASLGFVLRDMFGFVRVDQQQFSARTGMKKFSVMWHEVAKWRINELARTPEVACVELWRHEHPAAHRIPGGMLSEQDLGTIRQACRTYAGDKE